MPCRMLKITVVFKRMKTDAKYFITFKPITFFSVHYFTRPPSIRKLVFFQFQCLACICMTIDTNSGINMKLFIALNQREMGRKAQTYLSNFILLYLYFDIQSILQVRRIQLKYCLYRSHARGKYLI